MGQGEASSCRGMGQDVLEGAVLVNEVRRLAYVGEKQAASPGLGGAPPTQVCKSPSWIVGVKGVSEGHSYPLCFLGSLQHMVSSKSDRFSREPIPFSPSLKIKNLFHALFHSS